MTSLSRDHGGRVRQRMASMGRELFIASPTALAADASRHLPTCRLWPSSRPNNVRVDSTKFLAIAWPWTTDRPVGRLRHGAETPAHEGPNAAMSRPDPAEQSRSRRERILDAAFHAFADARLPRHGRRRHRGRRGDLEGRHLLPLPEQGIDLPRADGDDRRQARGAGRAGGRARDGAGRAGRGGDPHGAHDVRRPPDDGAAAVPRHDGRRARVPGRDERPPRALRAA